MLATAPTTPVAEYLSAHEDEERVTSTTNVKEIAVGALTITEPTKEEFLADLGWVRILPFTAEHAYVAGETEAGLRADPDVQQDRINWRSIDRRRSASDRRSSRHPQRRGLRRGLRRGVLIDELPDDFRPRL